MNQTIILLGLFILTTIFHAHPALASCLTSSKTPADGQFEIVANIPAYHGCPNLQDGKDTIIRVSVPGCFLVVRDTKNSEGPVSKVYTRGDACKWKEREIKEMSIRSPCCPIAEYSCYEGPPPSSQSKDAGINEVVCATGVGLYLDQYPYKENGMDLVKSYDFKTDSYISQTKKEVLKLEEISQMHRRAEISGNPMDCKPKYGPEEYNTCLRNVYRKITDTALEKKKPELCLPVKNYPKENSSDNAYENCIRNATMAAKSVALCKRYLNSESLASWLGKCLYELKASEKTCTLFKKSYSRDECYREMVACPQIKDPQTKKYCWRDKRSLFDGHKKEFIEACEQNMDCYQAAKPDTDKNWASYIETVSESGLSTHMLNQIYQDAAKTIFKKDPDLALSICKRMIVPPKTKIQTDCIQDVELSLRWREHETKMKAKYPDYKPQPW